MKSNIRIISSVAFFIVITLLFWIFSININQPIILYIGIPFSLSILLFFMKLTSPNDKVFVLKIPILVKKYALYILSIIAITAILFIPQFTGSMLEWMDMPAINWFRLFSSILLTTFLPGYFLLKILDKRNEISRPSSLVLSVLLSFFITFLTGFCSLLTNNSIPSTALQIVIATNILLAIIHFMFHIKQTEKNHLCFDLAEISLLLSILSTVIISSIFVMYYNFPLTLGDMWTHQAQTIQYSESFPVYAGLLVPDYPYLYHIYLAVTSSISGIPSALTEQSLFVFNFLPVLAFYSVTKKWFNEPKIKDIPVLAAFFSILLGFGSLYAIYLNTVGPIDIQNLLNIASFKTYDIIMRVIFNPTIVAPVAIIGIPVFLMLFDLSQEIKAGKIVVSCLVSILVATGYLAHIAEIIIFLLFFVFYSLINNRFRWHLNVGIMLGLIFVALIDLAAPSQTYIFSINNETGGSSLSLEYLFAFLFLIIGTVISTIRAKYSNRVAFSFRNFLTGVIKVWKYARWLLIYLYLLSVIVWFTVLNNFNIWNLGGYSFVPFFVFPIRLGPVGLIALLSIFAFLPDIIKDKRFLFFFVLMFVGFSLEQISNQVDLFYPSYRYATFTFLGACVIAAYGLKRSNIIQKIANSPFIDKKRIFVSLLLFMIIISGAFTTSLSYLSASYYSNRTENVSTNELQGLNYIMQNLTEDMRIVTFSAYSTKLLETFAGINPAQNFKAYTYILLDATDPQIIQYLLSSSNIRYVYVAQRDIAILNNSKGIFKNLLSSFSPALKNNDVTIYEVDQQSIVNATNAKYLLSYSATSGETLVNGSLTCVSDYVILSGNITSIDFNYDSAFISEILLYNQIRIETYNISCSILPSDRNSLLIEAHALTGRIVTNESSVILIKFSNGSIDTLNGSQSIRLMCSNTSISAISPFIEASGRIIFNSLDVRIRPVVPLAGISREKAVIEGTINFSVSFTTPNVILISSFEYVGSIEKMFENTSANLQIPWIAVLTSPYHIVLLFLMIILIAISVIKKCLIKIKLNQQK